MSYGLRKNAVVFIIHDKGQYLFLKRSHTGYGDGLYMFPGGHVEEGEMPLAAAVRELKEELGITVQPDNLTFLHVQTTLNHTVFFWHVDAFCGRIINAEPNKHDEIVFLSKNDDQIPPSIRQVIACFEKGIYYSEKRE